MKKLLITTVLLLSACATGPRLEEQNAAIAKTMASETDYYYEHNGKTATINAAKKSVKTMLKDPESAQFTNLRINKYGDGKLVCGSVNAKNSFGGYVGVRPFAASPSRAMLYEVSEHQFIENMVNSAINEACSN